MRTFKYRIVTGLVVLLAVSTAGAQRRPPEIGRKLLEPEKDRIEVRFALGHKTVSCHEFQLTARLDGRVLLQGRFVKGFVVPTPAKNFPKLDKLDLQLQCGSHRWHFSKVPETVFQSSWWWVGTDYPPFQETFQAWEQFKDAAWIQYLIVDPQGFFVEKHCPVKLKDVKPGPCYE